jgi:hypothetical protein
VQSRTPLAARRDARLVCTFIDGCRWIGLDRGMPKQDAVAILNEILAKRMRSSANA